MVLRFATELVHFPRFFLPTEWNRHYPGLVPLELSQFLAKINVALMREKLVKSS